MTARSSKTYAAGLALATATACCLVVGLAPRAWAQTADPAADSAAQDDETDAEGRETEEGGDARDKRLSDRIKSVQRKVFIKDSRLEIYPHFGIDLNDPFYAHLVVGGSLGFHVVDSLSLEGRFGYVLDSIEQDPIRFVRREVGALPERPPEFQLHGELDAIWAPFYGKISLFGEGILHFDTYIAVGGGVFKTDAGLSPAFNFGVGQRYFLTDWLVARVELRDYIFPDTRDNESDLQNLLLVNLSISAFFPTSFDYDFQ